MTHFSPHIFKKHDIRGVFPQEINEEVAYRLGQIFTYVIGNNPSIVIGADGRLSSPLLLDALIKGCLNQGATVHCIGVVPSPVVYYASHVLQAQAGIMVTASHNPAHYNGFKFVRGQRPFYGEDLQQLQQIPVPQSADTGVLRSLDIREKYIRTIIKKVPLKFSKRLKIVWDPGHGAVATILSDLLQHLDADHIVINNTVNGHFPSHHPDPMVASNMQQLRQLVLQQKADIGFAFDGDGDRLGVIDAQGKQWGNDIVLALFAKHILKERPGSAILMDIKSSQTVFDSVRRWGGDPYFIPTGYAILKTKMIEYAALLGGELSGHFVFADDDYYGYDDALYAALQFINILLECPGRADFYLEQFEKSLPQMVSTQAIRIPCAVTQAIELIDAIHQHLIKKNRQFIAIDGIRVQTPKGWWLLRRSHTEECLVVRCEAFHPEGLRQLKEEVKAYLQENGFYSDF